MTLEAVASLLVIGAAAVLSPVLADLADMGLAFVIFLAGYEPDPGRVAGRPLRLAAGGW